MTMTNGADVFTITIRKRPWWFWALAAIWLLLEILAVQTALASAEEGEPHAATISWIAAGVLAAAGGFAWLRGERPHKFGETNGQPKEASTSD
jgi:hypothetical protein